MTSALNGAGQSCCSVNTLVCSQPPHAHFSGLLKIVVLPDARRFMKIAHVWSRLICYLVAIHGFSYLPGASRLTEFRILLFQSCSHNS